MTRVTNGSRHVPWQVESDVHWLVSMVPGVEIPERFHPFVRVTTLASAGILFFVVPWTGVFMFAYWINAGWINGNCHHCMRGKSS